MFWGLLLAVAWRGHLGRARGIQRRGRGRAVPRLSTTFDHRPAGPAGLPQCDRRAPPGKESAPLFLWPGPRGGAALAEGGGAGGS
eukprot:5411444-Pyramimonas_sp.AAC.1